MSDRVKFLKCEICGNIAAMINDNGPKIVCCGKPMGVIKANTVDASKEKHVPLVTRVNGKLTVVVGAIAHPMEEKHYIEWICVVQNEYVQRVTLKPGDAPSYEFADINEGTSDIYAYCNLHGLWKTSI